MNEYLITELRKGRIDKGLKQKDVEKKTGIRNTTLSNYENGITEPSVDAFFKLCELYELDVISLIEKAYGMNLSIKKFHIKPSEIEMIKKYRDLDGHGKEMLDFTLEKEWGRTK